ncbi:MAG TPA: hypothetical protein PLR39_00940 [Treponemataceae bacterium]|nr:hypothetical protein [Treponemataceae bacterium]
MKTKKILLLGLILLLCLSSCTTFKAQGLSTYIPTSYENLGTFNESITVHKFLGSPAGSTLFNITQDTTNDAVEMLIWKEVKKRGGRGAIDIEIVYEGTFLNYLCNSLTSGIWAPAKLTVSGTVIR